MKQQHLKSMKINCFIVINAVLHQEVDAVLIVNGFCKEVFKELPMEFAVEAQKLVRQSV